MPTFFNRARDKIFEIPIWRRLVGIVDVAVELLEIAAADLLRRKEAEIFNQLEARFVGLEVLKRLFDQSPERWRGDLQFDARLGLELRQQIAESAMIVLVASHENAKLRARVLFRVVARGARALGIGAHERADDSKRPSALHYLATAETALGNQRPVRPYQRVPGHSHHASSPPTLFITPTDPADFIHVKTYHSIKLAATRRGPTWGRHDKWPR